MQALINYILAHTNRGECQCGLCVDKQPDRPAPQHSADVFFFWVSAVNDPSADSLRNLLELEYPSLDKLQQGPSYIEIGAELGHQEIALRLIGLGGLVGLWRVVTPAFFGFEGEGAREMAGMGMVMCSGLKPKEESDAPGI